MPRPWRRGRRGLDRGLAGRRLRLLERHGVVLGRAEIVVGLFGSVAASAAVPVSLFHHGRMLRPEPQWHLWRRAVGCKGCANDATPKPPGQREASNIIAPRNRQRILRHGVLPVAKRKNLAF